MKLLIVDDEIDAREALHALLLNYCSNDDQYFFAASVSEALNVIREEAPDLVFLDIEMPEHKGIELFEFVPDPKFQVIFVTAYDQYAVKAFEVAALDYLLKPVEPKKLVRAYHRAAENKRSESLKTQVALLSSQLKGNIESPKIAIPVAFGHQFVKADHIVGARADGAYTELWLEGEDNLYLSKRLNLVAELLPTSQFYRLNRSYVVNLSKVTGISKKDGGMVYLSNGEEIPVNRETREKLMEQVKL